MCALACALVATGAGEAPSPHRPADLHLASRATAPEAEPPAVDLPSPGIEPSRGTEPSASIEPSPGAEPSPGEASPGSSFVGTAPGLADVDPLNDHIVGPPPAIDDCPALLAGAGVRWSPANIGLAPPQNGVTICGAAQVVRYRFGPETIRYSSAPVVTCGLALALARFERIVQAQAQAILHRRVTKVDHQGTYNCRPMAAYDLVSEHSFANAIDLRRFHLQGGETVDVLRDFGPLDGAAPGPKAEFLRSVARRLYDEGVFSVVLTPYFDRHHRNHFHLDLARYRVDGAGPAPAAD